MNRAILTTLIIVSIMPAAFTQTLSQQPSASRCNLTLAQAPIIRGLRLGMGVDELLTLFPRSREDPEIISTLASAKGAPNYGLANLGFASHKYPSSPLSKNVNLFSIQMFDNRVSSIDVYYNGPAWTNVDEMIVKVAQSLNLPGAQDWSQSFSQNTKSLKCNGFEVSVTAVGEATCCSNIRFSISGIERQRMERKFAEQEKARSEFVP